MNKVILIGRITATPELKYTESNKALTRFIVAIDRNHSQEDKKTDFIPVIAWEKKAEAICKYLSKGNKIAIDGKLQSGSYERQDGKREYTLTVAVNGVEFLESKPKEEVPESRKIETDPFADFGSLMNDEEFPF